MKRLILLLLGLGLLGALGWLGRNVWQSTAFFERNGREATLVVGPRYNAAHWAMPPLKKIHTHAALLEPNYEVLIETDRELKEGETLTIRFLTRDLAAELRATSARPLANTIRLRAAEDGTPVRIEATDLFDRLVDRAMGPPAEGVYVRPRATAERAPDRDQPTVPFLFADAGDSTWTLIRRNSRVGEWLALGFGVLAAFWLLTSAWEDQRATLRPDSRRKGFVHPSLRRIEADTPAESSKKLTYVPKADEEIVLTEAEKTRLAAAKAQSPAAPAVPAPSPSPAPAPAPERPAPDPALTPIPFKRGLAKTAAEPAPAPAPVLVPPNTPSAPTEPGPAAAPLSDPTEPPSLSHNETAPPMPISTDKLVLKLPRKRQ